MTINKTLLSGVISFFLCFLVNLTCYAADTVLTICDDDSGLQAILNECTGFYFNTIQEAYNNALDQETLLCQGAVFSENLLFNDAANKTIVLKGGYDQAFSENLSGVT
ncbi:MAG: hypothetical protein DRI88_10025 [Bacteroidetes bacterium]|nr:MAG: hypothetical protein DRI88_10025 [Bacteroidota bacterium]